MLPHPNKLTFWRTLIFMQSFDKRQQHAQAKKNTIANVLKCMDHMTVGITSNVLQRIEKTLSFLMLEKKWLGL